MGIFFHTIRQEEIHILQVISLSMKPLSPGNLGHFFTRTTIGELMGTISPIFPPSGWAKTGKPIGWFHPVLSMITTSLFNDLRLLWSMIKYSCFFERTIVFMKIKKISMKKIITTKILLLFVLPLFCQSKYSIKIGKPEPISNNAGTFFDLYAEYYQKISSFNPLLQTNYLT